MLKGQDLKEANQRLNKEKRERCFKKLDEFAKKMVLEDGMSLRAIYAEDFITGPVYKWAQFEFFPATEEEKKEIRKVIEEEKKKEEKTEKK